MIGFSLPKDSIFLNCKRGELNFFQNLKKKIIIKCLSNCEWNGSGKNSHYPVDEIRITMFKFYHRNCVDVGHVCVCIYLIVDYY